MAGTLTIDTLKASSGVLATQNGMTGIAKAWVNFQGGFGNTAGTINNSFNVSSVTVNATGVFTINFTTAMPNVNYSMAVGGGRMSNGTSLDYAFQIQVTPTGVGGYTGYQTTSCQINTPSTSGGSTTWSIVNATFFA
jgi:hypothetical protein